MDNGRWVHNAYWSDDDGLIEWYEHSITGDCISADEYEDLKNMKEGT